MTQREKENKEYEEMNSFTEKVGGGMGVDVSSDDSDVIFWDPDEGSASMEEVRPADVSVKKIRTIEDESPVQAKPSVKNISTPVASAVEKRKTTGFDFEELAREIDSMDLSSTAGLTVAPLHTDEDFLSVLDDEQLNMIDEVISQSDSYSEIGAADVVEIEDESPFEKVSVIEEYEGLIESKPLWSDDDDFWIIDSEGFSVPPHEIIAYISSLKKADIEKIESISVPPQPQIQAEQITPAAADEPDQIIIAPKELPFADKPYILSYEHDAYFVDMARLIDGEPVREKEPEIEDTAAEIKAFNIPVFDEDAEIVVVEPIYLEGDSYFDSIVNTEQNEPANERTIENFSSDDRKSEIKNDREAIPAQEKEETPVLESRVKMKLPDDFTLTHMDLGEAEKIAHEDIYFLSEDDLIEELELRDLVPLEEEKLSAEKRLPVSDAEPRQDMQGGFIYITPEQSHLTDDVRKDVESDIKSPYALIVEEDAQEISRRLKDFEETVPAEQLFDITDRVVILEKEEDVDRFVSSIPAHKRDDMKRLLNYLDGLFEKLPEDVVKNFADSEYFDLYVKIMNDLSE